MAVVLYWKERLAARNPLCHATLRVEGYNIRPYLDRPEDTWPRAVARQALFLDYQAWFENTYLPPFQEAPYFRDFPDQLPKPADELAFFTTIAPFLYVVGKGQQVRSYLVNTRKTHEGKWISMKMHRYFVRLCEWEEHVASFKLQTGIDIDTKWYAAPANIARVAGAVRVSLRKIADNREAMEKQMGSGKGLDSTP